MAATSALGILIAQAVTVAKALTLVGLSSAKIVQLGGLSASTFQNHIPDPPAVIFAPFGGETFPGNDPAASDDIGYPVLCGILDRANEEHDADALDQRYLWRQQLIQAFIHAPMSVSLTNAVLYEQTIEPQPIIDPAAWEKNWHLSAFVIRCTVRHVNR